MEALSADTASDIGGTYTTSLGMGVGCVLLLTCSLGSWLQLLSAMPSALMVMKGNKA
ncbi:hypothetical protein GCM10009129_12580 [Psychrobacter aestuarii]|uniref:Uncharacterized protein n=1 Tax=Psychrobacter aestuarii TaxID=556327 RepID=A0ABN0VT71_9GAMM